MFQDFGVTQSNVVPRGRSSADDMTSTSLGRGASVGRPPSRTPRRALVHRSVRFVPAPRSSNDLVWSEGHVRSRNADSSSKMMALLTRLGKFARSSSRQRPFVRAACLSGPSPCGHADDDLAWQHVLRHDRSRPDARTRPDANAS